MMRSSTILNKFNFILYLKLLEKKNLQTFQYHVTLILFLTLIKIRLHQDKLFTIRPVVPLKYHQHGLL